MHLQSAPTRELERGNYRLLAILMRFCAPASAASARWRLMANSQPPRAQNCFIVEPENTFTF